MGFAIGLQLGASCLWLSGMDGFLTGAIGFILALSGLMGLMLAPTNLKNPD
jgi:hypothetical protein